MRTILKYIKNDGLASNIPGFNVKEVLDATIKLIKDPSAKIMLIPDSPTGCDIVDIGDFKEINKSGNGKVVMQSTYEIDYNQGTITITTLPYNSDSATVISKLIELRKKGDPILQALVKIDDLTKNDVTNIIIQLDKSSDVKPDKFINHILKKSIGLKDTFPCGLVVIDDYEDEEYGVKDLLLAWIEYRIDIVRSMMLNNLEQLLNKQHMNEVLLMVFNKSNIDDTIKIARNSASRKYTIEKLMKRFKITSVQAATIADMHVYNFNEDSYNRYLEDKKSLKEEIKKVEAILTDDDKINEFVINQLEEGKKKYGKPRRSKVIKLDGSEEDIPDTEHLIGVSESGMIKKLSIKNTSIGIVGKSNEAVSVLQVNNRESLLVVDSSGLVSKISISSIPNMNFEDTGIPLSQLFTVKGNICGMMELPTMDILDKDDESLCISFITKKGYAKRVKISEFKNITKSKQGITLTKGDELAVANFELGGIDNDIIIYTNEGNGVRIPISELRLYGCNSRGLSVIKLNGTESIVGASRIKKGKKYIFFITSGGRCKLTETKYFPAMKRNEETLNLTSLSKGEFLLGVSAVDKGDVIIAYRKKEEPVEIKVSDLPITTRMAACEKIIKTNKGDSVVAYKAFTK